MRQQKICHPSGSTAASQVRQGAEESQTQEQREVEAPKDENEQLLLDNPGLHNFWDGKKWVVSHERFQDAAQRAGVTLPSQPSVEPADLFETVRSYAGRQPQVFKWAGVSAVPEEVRWSSGDLVQLLSEPLLEELGCNVDDFLEEYGEITEIPCLNGPCNVSVVRIETPAHLDIDREKVGDILKDAVLSSLKDVVRTTSDKVGQRIIASSLEFTGLKQPRFLDTREIHPPVCAVQFSSLDFSGLPLQEIRDANPAQRKVWVFEDVSQGFAVVHDGSRRYVTSKNPLVMGLARITFLSKGADISGGLESFDSRLKKFVLSLQKARFSVVLALSQSDSDEELLREAEQFTAEARKLLTHPNPVFIKSTRSSGGKLVLRCSKDAAGAPVIESDSSEVGHLLAQYTRSVSRAVVQDSANIVENVLAPTNAKFVVKHGSVAAFLGRALKCMETPIVEEEISVTRVRTRLGSEKAEFRMILQGLDQLSLVAHYAKASLSDIAANISLGGQGRATQQVVRAIYQQELAGRMGQSEINRRAGESFKKLLEIAETFGQEFAKKLAKSQSAPVLSDFAVDICPVWDPKFQELRYFLLEVQYGYGFSGLRSVHPDKAEEVQSFKIKAAHSRKAANSQQCLLNLLAEDRAKGES